jgi:hypothetical protein
MDAEVERRIEQLEQRVNDEDRISRIERKTIRIGMLVIVTLTLLVIIVNKMFEVIHAITTAWNSIWG